MSEVNLRPGWLERQFVSVDAEKKTWPAWMHRNYERDAAALVAEEVVMLLTEEERQRFVEYLELEIKSSGAIIEQAENTNLPPGLINNYKREVMAMLVVMNRLKNVEVQTIGGGR